MVIEKKRPFDGVRRVIAKIGNVFGIDSTVKHIADNVIGIARYFVPGKLVITAGFNGFNHFNGFFFALYHFYKQPSRRFGIFRHFNDNFFANIPC